MVFSINTFFKSHLNVLILIMFYLHSTLAYSFCWLDFYKSLYRPDKKTFNKNNRHMQIYSLIVFVNVGKTNSLKSLLGDVLSDVLCSRCSIWDYNLHQWYFCSGDRCWCLHCLVWAEWHVYISEITLSQQEREVHVFWTRSWEYVHCRGKTNTSTNTHTHLILLIRFLFVWLI